MDHVVGIGQYVISDNKEDFISTYALGSCVAVTVYCPSRSVAGMIHIALPNKLISGDRLYSPYYYADTGLPIFIREIIHRYGCDKRELTVGLYGGAKSLKKDIFDIGPKNAETIKEILRSYNMYPAIDATGGNISRTIYMSVLTGGVDTVVQPMII